MVKPIYGLKDAPRAWRKKLHQVLIDWNSSRQLYAEPELYCTHVEQKDGPNRLERLDPIKRAIEHNAEQAEQNVTRTLPEVSLRQLTCITSVHVDDLKGAARRETAEALLKHLESRVGKCKADYLTFDHTGIQHEQKSGNVYTCQLKYIEAIQPIDKQLWQGMADDAPVTPKLRICWISQFAGSDALCGAPSPPNSMG